MIALDACIDCVQAAVNGEFPEDDSERERIERALTEWADEGYPIITTAPDDEAEGFFSWSPCGVCGSHLGGARLAMVALSVDIEREV